ncbi:MAG TPA: hypothetical protein VHM90_16405 [Phycisphaerae bacterium]|nr:hypothetical protein [Phycisphaerae bacterium]
MILGLLLLLASRHTLRAGVAVSPLKQEISLRPDESGTLKITLTNNSHGLLDPPQTVNLALADVQVTEGGVLNFKDPGTLPSSAAKWVALSQKEASLAPGKTQVVECAITPPPGAAPGEYYVSVLVTLANKERNEKGVMVEYRIASGIFVTVLGRTFPKQAKIVRAELNWPQIPACEPATQAATQPGEKPAEPEAPKVTVLLQNTGQARFDASGKMTIVDERSRIVFVSALGSVRPCVFGGDSRLFEAPITKALPAGKYRLKFEMDYQSTWALARYEMPVEILPEYADALARLRTGGDAVAFPADVGPEKLAPAMPPGATRSLALAIRNTTDGPLTCSTSVAASETPSPADAWITVSPARFIIDKSGRKSMEVKVQVPRDAKPGSYLSHVLLEAGPDGSVPAKLSVPVELEVRSEKSP